MRAGSIQHLPINVNTVGTHAQVPGQAGFDVALVNYVIMAAGAVTVTFEDADGTDRHGPFPLAANGGIAAPDSNAGWTRTGSGQGLNIRLNANVLVGGGITYRMVPHHLEF